MMHFNKELDMRRCPSPLSLTILLPLLLLSPSVSSAATLNLLPRGSSLSLADILVSQNNTFSCGFNEVGKNAFTFSIWFSNSANKTIVWSANRDRPVNRGSQITLRREGAMVLTDVDDTPVWRADVNSTEVDQAMLLENGNLVLLGSHGNTLWQSFDSPTDTLLPMQPITKTIKLVSAKANGSVSSGYYSFYFDNDNVLRLIYDGPEISSIYWPNPDYQVFQNGRTLYNSSRYGVLDEQGQFVASDRFAFNASDWGPGISRRLTLDYDGNLRLYSLVESSGLWSVSWQAFQGACDVHGLCGRNGICGYYQLRPACSCPAGYEMSDPSDWSRGCKPKFGINCDSPQQVKFLKLTHTDFWGYDLNYSHAVSLKTCKKLCRNDCSCEGLAYKVGSGDCFRKNALFNGRTTPSTPSNVYLKVPKSMQKTGMPAFQAHMPYCNASKADGITSPAEVSKKSHGKWVYFWWFLSAFGAIEVLFIAFGWWFIFRREGKPKSLEQGYKMIFSQFKRFTYSELKKATGNFKDELGRGGSGAVYKGVLDDNRVVAVKKLEDVIQGEEEFWAEVSMIGRIYHMNLVRMWGFCTERTHKLLVYKYMDNGSLDKHLFGNTNTNNLLGWSERFKIAVGVAKGLAYLHHECLEWVIHCDVKPENILLDTDFEPKIADFGLAKLLKRGGANSNFSRIRGTRGYMAPEWASNLPITAKADVYSYGVMLLEIVRGSRVSSLTADGEEEREAGLKQLVKVLKQKLCGGEDLWLGEFVDAGLEGQFDYRQAALMVEIALSCLEEERSRRPTMDAVVQRLLSFDDHGYSSVLMQ